jgi:peptidyl-prolyl cis-trans isomerase C
MRLALLPLLTLSLSAQTPAEAPKPAPAPVKAEQPRENKVLASINGKVYRDSDLDAYIATAYNDQQRAQISVVAGARQQVEQQFLQARLLEAKARQEKLDRTPAYAEKLSMAEMDVLVRMLFDRDGEKLRAQLNLKDEDYKAFYEGNKDKFMSPESFSVRHILISVKGGPAADGKGLTEDEAKAKVAKIQADLKAGKKMEDLAKDNSDDPGSKDKGGLYENIAFGSFTPEFEAAVRKQAVGTVGEPIKTTYGYHLIQVEKLNAPKLQAFDEVKDKVRQLAMQARQEQVMKAYLDAAKKDISYVEGPAAEKAAAKPAPRAKKSATGAKK